jgi:hypothetical protein
LQLAVRRLRLLWLKSGSATFAWPLRSGKVALAEDINWRYAEFAGTL